MIKMQIDLPSYKSMEPAVAARFKRIYQRPVVLEIEQVGKTFISPQEEKIYALKDISFTVHRREFICLIGPSGCGKSTLNRIISGLDYPSEGRVLLDGEEIQGPGPDRGMVFQSYTLFPWLTVKQNVMYGLRRQGKDESIAESEAMTWIAMVGLKTFKDHYPAQLSGGMMQRVAIARALANNPRILLMDEPFGALDALTRAQMQMYLLDIWRNVDVTIVFVTHDLDEAVLLADRTVVLGRNPGHLKEIIEVPVPRPRRHDDLLSPPFLATKKHLESLIHPPEETGTGGFKMPRMTQAGDDVL